MITARSIAELSSALEPIRARRAVIALVPTMGALHAGHLSLVDAARSECDIVVLSVFVNPAQFGEDEDFTRYPRDAERDARVADGAGVDVLFTPTADELYPAGFSTWVEVDGLSHRLEGAQRAGHFRGVATVCLKLFNIVRPDRAYFGKKDAQQVAVIRQLVRDLNLGLAVRVLPTVRDPDGLALSSRNAQLSADERRAALALPRALERGAAAHRAGEDAASAARAELDGLTPDYLEVAELDGRLVLAVAARVGRTRLIDNVVLDEGDPT